MREDIFDVSQAFLEGRQEGIQQERERWVKIIKEVIEKSYGWDIQDLRDKLKEQIGDKKQ